MNYGHTYILGNTLQFGSNTYVFVSVSTCLCIWD